MLDIKKELITRLALLNWKPSDLARNYCILNNIEPNRQNMKRIDVRIRRLLDDPSKVSLLRCAEILHAAGGVIEVRWIDEELIKKLKNA